MRPASAQPCTVTPLPHPRAGVNVLARTALLCAALLVATAVVATPDFFSARVVAGYQKRFGADALERLYAWRSVLEEQAGRAVDGQRVAVNRFFNRIPWVDDRDHWGVADYWATPFEMLGTNGGDCEDYSIAKYFSLAALDVPIERLVITYVRAVTLRQPHMVLAYYETPGADPLILDNLRGEIVRGSERPDLVPVYSFNGDGLWMAVSRGEGRRIGSAARLAPWRALLERLADETG